VSIRDADKAKVEEGLVEAEGSSFLQLWRTRTVRERLPESNATVMLLLYLV